MVRALVDRDRVVVATEHHERPREQLEVLGLEWHFLVGARKRFVRLEPGVALVRIAATFEVRLQGAHPRVNLAAGTSAV
jgi:hypothetical protein